ncbi:MAG: helix-turn-helix transcriptional regulator [Treponema sp.]|jgi:transcriptional regulator with XRE-family HTH domain|nr:helix-turn-helix transcriptional regulator [Treponema sp.]
MTLQELFVRNLKYYRKQKKLTQNELTLAIDMGYNYINGVEQQKYFPQPDVIEKIARVLEIKPVLLFAENPIEQKLRDIDGQFSDELVEKLYSRIKNSIRHEIKEEIEQCLNQNR